MTWILSALFLALISAGVTYMIMTIIGTEEVEISFRDYIETYVVVIMVLSFFIYVLGV